MSPSLIESLDHHARARPDAPAVREIRESGARRCLSWRELRGAAHRLRARLRESAASGVVMAISPNCIEMPVCLLGALWSESSVLPVSPQLTASELSEVARRARVEAVIGDSSALATLCQGAGLRSLCLDAIELEESSPSRPGDLKAGGAILLQSSGTTGRPKIVRRVATAFDAVGDNVRRALDLGESDSMLVTIPLYHSYGIDLLMAAVMAGCCIELHERFVPALARAALVDRGISVLPAVPLMFDALSRGGVGELRSLALRRAISAGSPLPQRVFDQFERAYGTRIGQIYGATEFGSVTFGDPEAPDFDPGVVGLPLRGAEIRIVDLDQPRMDRTLPSGVEGQVAVAAPSMLSGYVDDPGGPDDEGFLLTGDIGSLDERGRLRLSGRVRLLIDVGALKVNPLEVESILMRHPDVSEAVVVALPFSDTADRLKAIVIPETGCDVDVAELKRFAREHLAPFKLPRSFEIRTQVPRSPTGKILRRELQAEVRGSRSAPSRSPATESEAVDGETGDALRSKLE